MRVVAAMSGGVDSAVAASRMIEAGHEVVGVHLALSRSAATLRESARGCCTIEDAGDARRVADRLGIPFYVWDLASRFERDVVEDFAAEYAAGRTPNPCLRCNERIKFAGLLDKAVALGFDAVATGHYAQIVQGPAGRELHRAGDAATDHSYVPGALEADQLARAHDRVAHRGLGGIERVDQLAIGLTDQLRQHLLDELDHVAARAIERIRDRHDVGALRDPELLERFARGARDLRIAIAQEHRELGAGVSQRGQRVQRLGPHGATAITQLFDQLGYITHERPRYYERQAFARISSASR